jgi:F-type H+-transporting ATPase subunit gamma
MANLHEIKRRIESTKKTEQITNAMQMVSQSKLNKTLKYTAEYQNYATHVQEIINHLVQAHLFDSGGVQTVIPMLHDRPIKKTGILVVTSDRGLVGGYNSNIFKATNELIKENKLNPSNAIIYAAGGNGANYYRKLGYTIAVDYEGMDDVPTFEQIQSIVKAVSQDYLDEKIDLLLINYNHFVNRLTNEFRSVQILPLNAGNVDTEVKTEFSYQDYEFEPDQIELLKAILPQFSESLVYGAILDAKTAEHAASSQAMTAATNNADDVIAKLDLQYNRARQSAITTEITEITAGMAALE